MERRDYIRRIAEQHTHPVARAQRVFLEEPSFAIGDKKDIEFDIKSNLSTYFNVPFRSVVFCGSAHLGFSPHKNTDLKLGESDLDVAIVSMDAFQKAWMILTDTTRAFSDLSGFPNGQRGLEISERVKEMITKRGLIHLAEMPQRCQFDKDKTFLDEVSRRYNTIFSNVNVTFYMSEHAFCWKQNWAIQKMLRR